MISYKSFLYTKSYNYHIYQFSACPSDQLIAVITLKIYNNILLL